MSLENYKIFIPAGNATAIVFGEFSAGKRKILNDEIMRRHDFVEQVAFLNGENLTMAGGESCVNAIRSAAFYLLKSLRLNLCKITANGEIYECGFCENGVFVRGKILQDCGVKILNRQNFIVKFNEITHFVSFEPLKFQSENELKDYAMQIFKTHDLLKFKACGFMNFNENAIKPVVFVRDINTLFYETACGSGSICVALAKFSQDKNFSEIKIKQPSGKFLNVKILNNAQNFEISGEVLEYKIL